jgi:multidrug transporter EmrE-like cation transporter
LNISTIIRDKIESFSEEGAAYLLALFLVIISSLIFLIAKKELEVDVSYIFWISILPCIYGLTIYLYDVFKKICSNLIGKGITTLTFIFISTFNLSLATQTINTTLGAGLTHQCLHFEQT